LDLSTSDYNLLFGCPLYSVVVVCRLYSICECVRRFGKDMEGSGHGIIEVIPKYFLEANKGFSNWSGPALKFDVGTSRFQI